MARMESPQGSCHAAAPLVKFTPHLHCLPSPWKRAAKHRTRRIPCRAKCRLAATGGGGEVFASILSSVLSRMTLGGICKTHCAEIMFQKNGIQLLLIRIFFLRFATFCWENCPFGVIKLNSRKMGCVWDKI